MERRSKDDRLVSDGPPNRLEGPARGGFRYTFDLAKKKIESQANTGQSLEFPTFVLR